VILEGHRPRSSDQGECILEDIRMEDLPNEDNIDPLPRHVYFTFPGDETVEAEIKTEAYQIEDPTVLAYRCRPRCKTLIIIDYGGVLLDLNCSLILSTKTKSTKVNVIFFPFFFKKKKFIY